MLNIHEIEEVLRKVYEAAHEESIATNEACIANPNNTEIWKEGELATARSIALFDALDIVTKISWYSNETAEEIVNRIVKAVTFKAEYPVKKMWDDSEEAKPQEEELMELSA